MPNDNTRAPVAFAAAARKTSLVTFCDVSALEKQMMAVSEQINLPTRFTALLAQLARHGLISVMAPGQSPVQGFDDDNALVPVSANKMAEDSEFVTNRAPGTPFRDRSIWVRFMLNGRFPQFARGPRQCH